MFLKGIVLVVINLFRLEDDKYVEMFLEIGVFTTINVAEYRITTLEQQIHSTLHHSTDALNNSIRAAPLQATHNGLAAARLNITSIFRGRVATPKKEKYPWYKHTHTGQIRHSS